MIANGFAKVVKNRMEFARSDWETDLKNARNLEWKVVR